jgi:type II secretory pathway component PulF
MPPFLQHLLQLNQQFLPDARALTYEALARTLGAGLPIPQALGISGASGPLASTLVAISDACEREGLSLTEALARYPETFPETERRMLATGEQTGELPRILRRLAEQLSRRSARRKAWLATLIYPLVLVHGVIFALAAPQILQGPRAFAAATLPSLLLLWAAISVGVVLAAQLLGQRGGRRRAVDAMAALPGGAFLRDRAVADFAAVFGLALDAGVPLLESLRIAGEASSWGPIEASAHGAAHHLAHGDQLWQALSRYSCFPEELLGAIRVGETSGSLTETVAAAGDLLAQRAERRANRLAVLVPVTLYLLVALLVAVVVIEAFAGLVSF